MIQNKWTTLAIMDGKQRNTGCPFLQSEAKDKWVNKQWTAFKNEKKREPDMYKKHSKVLILHAINGEKA